MISIIVSSYRSAYLKAFRENVQQTIGVPYEIIGMENKGEMGICKAYNKGASKAEFELLCFVHEDVEFVTKDWGRKIIELFKSDQELALAGVGGCKYKSQYVTGWTSGVKELDMANVMHRSEEKEVRRYRLNPGNEEVSNAVVLDGVCLFMRKNEWEVTRFDERLEGFHFYDVDISLRINNRGKKVAVIFFIDLIHYSKGKFNDDWLKAAFDYHKQKEKRDIIRKLQNKADSKRYDKAIRLFWISRLAGESVSSLGYIKLLISNYHFYEKGFSFIRGKIKAKVQSVIHGYTN